MSDRTRPFPILASSNLRDRPTACSWADAERAYVGYVAKYGAFQSLDRIADRGGFGRSEMDEFAPGWAPVG